MIFNGSSPVKLNKFRHLLCHRPLLGFIKDFEAIMCTMINHIYCTHFLKTPTSWHTFFWSNTGGLKDRNDLRISTTPHLAGPGDASSESGPTGLALAWLVNWKKDWGAMNQRSGEKRCVVFCGRVFLCWICGSLANLSWMWVTLVMNWLVWTFWDAALVRERMRKTWWLCLSPSLQFFNSCLFRFHHTSKSEALA